MSLKSTLSVILFVFIILLSALDCFAFEDKIVFYSLDDLYKIALKDAENIKISEQELEFAKNTDKKAHSTLFPTISSNVGFRKFDDKSVVYPDTFSWEVKMKYSFTINAKELLAIKITQDTLKQRKHELDVVKEDYLFQIAVAYYTVLQAKKSIEICKANVARLTKHKEAVAYRLALEEVTKTDHFRAEAELSKSKAELVTSKNTLRLARASLLRLVKIPKSFELKEVDLQVSKLIDRNLEIIKEQGIKERAELKSLYIQEQVAKDNVKWYKSEYWPTLDLESAYQGYDGSPPEAFPDNNVIYGSIKLNCKIFDAGYRDAEIGESLARLRQSSLSIDSMKKQIMFEIEEAYLEAMNQKSVLESFKDQLKFANENYNALSQQFKYGLSNSIDMMDANTLLVTSERQLSEAEYGYKLSELKLQRAKGTFLKSVLNK